MYYLKLQYKMLIQRKRKKKGMIAKIIPEERDLKTGPLITRKRKLEVFMQAWTSQSMFQVSQTIWHQTRMLLYHTIIMLIKYFTYSSDLDISYIYPPSLQLRGKESLLYLPTPTCQHNQTVK
jgi:hypothetical protein